MLGYVLGLSNACPERYGLLFERFTDPDRSEYPDIDIDICQDGRGDAFIIGSSTSGFSMNLNKQPDAFNSESDIDIILESDGLLVQMMVAGGEPDTETSFMGKYLWLRNDGPNGFLTACPHLATFAAEWSKELGRPVDVKLLLASRGNSEALDTMLDYASPDGGGPIDLVLAGVPLGDSSRRAVTERANEGGFWNRLFGTRN